MVQFTPPPDSQFSQFTAETPELPLLVKARGACAQLSCRCIDTLQGRQLINPSISKKEVDLLIHLFEAFRYISCRDDVSRTNNSS